MKHLVLFEKFYTPPVEIKERLKKIVLDLEKKYKGGKQFFDALDNQIKDITNQDMILSLVKGLSDEWIATSGGFGDELYSLWVNGKFKCKGMVVFNGKMLTNKTNVKFWYPPEFELNNKEFIYVDDSYFSGSTTRKIGKFLSDYNSTIKKVFVIYDGSLDRVSWVKSFFRYYD